jgi:hypothetical protein
VSKLGILYGVSNLPWVSELLVSAASVKTQMPDVRITLSIDEATLNAIPDIIDLGRYFDDIQPYSDEATFRSSKFSALANPHCDRNIFLDTDTYLHYPVYELYETLDRFDIGAMIAPQRLHGKSIEKDFYSFFKPVPSSFPEYNNGVVPFKKSDRYFQFLEQYQSIYAQGVEKADYQMDQPSFRVALYHSDLRLFPLSPEYNFRANIANVVKGKVKIIHGHGHLRTIALLANENEKSIRVLPPRRELLTGKIPSGYLQQGNTSVMEDQLVETWNKLMVSE